MDRQVDRDSQPNFPLENIGFSASNTLFIQTSDWFSMNNPLKKISKILNLTFKEKQIF